MIPLNNLTQSDLLGEVFIHSPCDEPLETSLSRLEKAIISDFYAGGVREITLPDDPIPTFSPSSVFTAYLTHDDLLRSENAESDN